MHGVEHQLPRPRGPAVAKIVNALMRTARATRSPGEAGEKTRPTENCTRGPVSLRTEPSRPAPQEADEHNRHVTPHNLTIMINGAFAPKMYRRVGTTPIATATEAGGQGNDRSVLRTTAGAQSTKHAYPPGPGGLQSLDAVRDRRELVDVRQ